MKKVIVIFFFGMLLLLTGVFLFVNKLQGYPHLWMITGLAFEALSIFMMFRTKKN